MPALGDHLPSGSSIQPLESSRLSTAYGICAATLSQGNQEERLGSFCLSQVVIDPPRFDQAREDVFSTLSSMIGHSK